MRRVFSYEAQVYYLCAYEKSTGLGKRVWNMIEAERKHQLWLEKQPNLIKDSARFGYTLR